jgi:peptidoglycan/LPS O-acetylase OafA/YrhL
MLFFEVFPLQEAGFRGEYVLGISWYLSAMFLALALLYPLCKKFGSTMTMVVCPIASFLIYGALSFHYGDIAIARTYFGDSFISSGLLRGVAACAAGCTLYEVCEALSKKKVTMLGRALFTLAEVLLLAFFIHTMHVHPKSRYDYLLVFVIFLMLTIGVGGLSFSSYVLRGKFTKVLGTASTMIVLTHYGLNLLFDYWFGDKYYLTDKYNLYLLVLALSCVAVWLVGEGLQRLAKKVSVSLKPRIWAK